MNGKPSRYVRTTITIPRELKRRMLRERTVNWSAVACQAFEAKLSDLFKQTGEHKMSDTPPMDDAIERLRRLKNLPEATEGPLDPRDFESGFQRGRRWAMATATPQELGRLEVFSKQIHGTWQLFDAKEVMKRLASAVTGAEIPPRGSRPPEVLKDFWPVKIGLSEKLNDYLSFARGFCEGAMGFWNDAKAKI